jgi:hypothetical protein
MRATREKIRWLRLATLATGTAFFLEGCDPSVKTTIENGIINVANSLLTAFLQALVQLGAEASQAAA